MPQSAHPRHVFKNIPKSLAHRVVRVVSMPELRKIRLEELKTLLISRGYRQSHLKSAMEYALNLDRDEALKKVERVDNANSDRVIYTITFNPKLPFLPSILKKNWQVMVYSDQRLQRAFPGPPMACLKRGPNLGEKLIQAKVPPPPRRVGLRGDKRKCGFRSCKAGRRVCSMCPFTGAASDNKTVIAR